MSLTIPNIYIDGTPVSADDINENYQAVRDYINGEILISDLDGYLEYEHLAEPDIEYSDDFATEIEFVSAYTYNHQRPYEEDAGSHTSFNTNHLKGNNFRLRDTYEDVAGVGKRFYLQKTANVLVTIYAYAYAHDNMVQSAIADSDEYVLYVDGNDDTNREDSTLRYISDLVNVSSILALPPNYADLEDKFQPLQIYWSGFLASGWHTIQLKINALNESSVVKIKFIDIEAIY